MIFKNHFCILFLILLLRFVDALKVHSTHVFLLLRNKTTKDIKLIFFNEKLNRFYN